MSKQSINAWLIGIGLVLFVWHMKVPDQFQMFVFFPWIGLALLIIAVSSFITSSKHIELGQNKVWIPLAIISASIALSGVEAYLEHRALLTEAIAMAMVAMVFFGLYLSSRQFGSVIYKIMPYVVVVESISIPIVASLNNWLPNGGLISWTNYDIATGLIIFGILVSPRKTWWWLSTIGAVGLLFSGSAEAMVVGGILLIVALATKTEWWKVVAPVVAVIIVSAILIPLGIFTKVQVPNVERLSMLGLTYDKNHTEIWEQLLHQSRQIMGNIERDDTIKPITIDMSNTKGIDIVMGYRLSHWQLTMPIKPFGYGLNLTRFYWGIPHNVVLIIIEQVGILAALAWLYIAWLGIKQKSTRIMWIGFVALGILDHFMWTQAAPWFWVLAGTTLNMIGDKVAETRTLAKDSQSREGYSVP